VSAGRRGPDLPALVLAALAALAAAIISHVVFGRIPHVQDSIAQLFQGRIFADGRLWAPAPPFRECFDYTHMLIDRGRWYSQYPPGHALLLVPGIWLGVPWLTNPLLGGVSIYGTFLLGRALFGRAAGRLAAVLGLLSPFLLLMAAEFMAHVSALAALTYFLVFLVRALRPAEDPADPRQAAGRRRDGMLAGACLLLGVLIRPFTAFAVAVPAFLYALWLLRRDRGGMPALVWTAAGGAAGVVLLGLYNWGTTGDPLVTGYVRLYGPSHGIGFGRGSWGPPHTLERGLRHAAANLQSLNGRLFEWPVTSLVPLLLALLPARWLQAGKRGAAPSRARGVASVAPHSRARGASIAGPHSGPRGASIAEPHSSAQGAAIARSQGGPRASSLLPGAAYFLAAIPVSLLAAYVFYWYHDLCFGPRYLYEALAPLLVLSAVGLLRLSGAVAAWMRVPERGPLVLALLLAVLSGAAFGVGWPALFRPPAWAEGAPPGSGPRFGSYFQYYSRQYWGVSPYLGEEVARRVPDRALVLVRLLEPEPETAMARFLAFGSAFARMEPDLRTARVIYAREMGPLSGKLAAILPDRSIYRYTGTIVEGKIELLRGPIGGQAQPSPAQAPRPGRGE